MLNTDLARERAFVGALAVVAVVSAVGCSEDQPPWDGAGAGSTTGYAGAGGGGISLPPAPSCTPSPAGGTTDVAVPELMITLFDSWEEGWLGSAAIVDLDDDGANEIVLARSNKLYAFNADGTIQWMFEDAPGRIWASPVVADFRDDSQLETVFASHGQIFMLDADGALLSGFPVPWETELRSIAAGDLNADGQLDIVVATTNGGNDDLIHAFRANGAPLDGFPPNGTGTSGCDDGCSFAGCFDQNLAVGDLDGDGHADVVAPHDNTRVSIQMGTGVAFDAHAMFPATKSPGVRYFHDLALAQEGWAEDEETALQAHFTNTPPAIADLDGDGSYDVILLASVQNAAQTDRYQGVALWAVRHDVSRLAGWEAPVHFPDYLAGLWDLEGNIVAATNQVTVADLDPTLPGPELVFAGFDGHIHAVEANGTPLWQYRYTDDPLVLTGGVAVADLSADGIPEIVFNSYSQEEERSALFILDAGGNPLHEISLPQRGSMAVPTIGDVDGDGQLEIVVSLKDAEDGVQSALVYTVPASETNCLLWPTGRGNYQRNGWVRSE